MSLLFSPLTTIVGYQVCEARPHGQFGNSFMKRGILFVLETDIPKTI